MQCLRLASGRREAGHRDEFGELPKVLGGCCEDEFITRAARSSKSQTVEPENALEMSEQHLNLFPKPT